MKENTLSNSENKLKNEVLVKGSYQIDNIAVCVEAEIKRLEKQVDLFWDEEIELYKKAGVRDHMSVMELGSGPGFVTRRLLQEFPNSSVCCVERDPNLVQYAKQCCGKYDNIEYLNASVEQIMKIDRKFDVIIARLLIEHLVDPLAVLRYAHQRLKNGGVLIVIDNDFEIHTVTYPESPSLRFFFDAYCKLKEEEGGSPKIGRKLPLLFKRAGFKKISLKTLTAHSQLQGDDVFLKSEGLGIPLQLVKKKYLTSKELAQIVKERKILLSQKDHCIMRQVLFASGVK